MKLDDLRVDPARRDGGRWFDVYKGWRWKLRSSQSAEFTNALQRHRSAFALVLEMGGPKAAKIETDTAIRAIAEALVVDVEPIDGFEFTGPESIITLFEDERLSHVYTRVVECATDIDAFIGIRAEAIEGKSDGPSAGMNSTEGT